MTDKKQTGGQNISSGRDHQPDKKKQPVPGAEKIYSDEGSQGTGGGSGRSRQNDDAPDLQPGPTKSKPE